MDCGGGGGGGGGGGSRSDSGCSYITWVLVEDVDYRSGDIKCFGSHLWRR